MDDIDLLQEREERAAPARIAASRKPVGPDPTGNCLNCDEPLAIGCRWCGADCLFDWQKQQRADAQRPVL
jgi:hypothetical protein